MTTTFAESLARFPARTAPVEGGVVEWRESGGAAEVTHVLLHGIGSGSGSWLRQLMAAEGQANVRVIAWNAPGYGGSTHLAAPSPTAADYALRMWAWLDALGVARVDEPLTPLKELTPIRPVTLAGHSLGALMATSGTASQPTRIARLALLSPARGYGNAAAEERDKKLGDRLATLDALGAQGIADKRGSAMLSAEAQPELVAYVKSIMASVDPAGYTQAARMLSTGVLGQDIARLRSAAPTLQIAVASGSADTITPPAGCQAVAAEAGVAWQDLGMAGHACALEAAARVNALLSLPEQNKEIA